MKITEKELKLFGELYEEIDIVVDNKISQIISEYNEIIMKNRVDGKDVIKQLPSYEYEYSIDGDTVRWEYEVYCRGCYMETEHGHLPLKTFFNEKWKDDLVEHINKVKIEKEKEFEERNKQIEERKLFEKLKAKYETGE